MKRPRILESMPSDSGKEERHEKVLSILLALLIMQAALPDHVHIVGIFPPCTVKV